MASTWAVSVFPEDVTFTHNWTIDDLVKGLERDDDGAIESPSFKMPGLPWDFFLRITRTVFKFKTVPDGEVAEFRCPKELEIERAIIPITSFFGVQLCVENPEEKMADLKELKLAGTLTLSETDDQKVERLKLTGQIYSWNGPPELGGEKRTGLTRFSEWSKGWEFGTEDITYDKPCQMDNSQGLYYDFYTLGDAPRMTLKAQITIPSKMVSNAYSCDNAKIIINEPYNKKIKVPESGILNQRKNLGSPSREEERLRSEVRQLSVNLAMIKSGINHLISDPSTPSSMIHSLKLLKHSSTFSAADASEGSEATRVKIEKDIKEEYFELESPKQEVPPKDEPDHDQPDSDGSLVSGQEPDEAKTHQEITEEKSREHDSGNIVRHKVAGEDTDNKFTRPAEEMERPKGGRGKKRKGYQNFEVVYM